LIIPASLIEALGDLEEVSENKETLLALVKDILDIIIEVKLDCARTQRYGEAGMFRDLELDIKKIYFPHLIQPNTPTKLWKVLQQKRLI
jgi:hypothetical protein